MIWDIIQESGFDKHFQNQTLTIQQLLVDENILTEMQNLHPELLKFINRNLDSVIQKLIKYVIEMPKEEQGYDRCHRLPYISSEMLAIDSQLFYQAFFGKKVEIIEQFAQYQQTVHLRKLFGYLNTNQVNNQLLLGYFEKVANNLYKGRKLQFTKAVATNLPLFSKNLHLETIGNILKNCVILIGQKQGVLFEERKKILRTIIMYLVQPNTADKQTQVREVCSDALVEIIGRHKTFSSGDQLLNYTLNSCGDMLILYSKVEVPQICTFLIGLLTKSTQKIYDPETDKKLPIFSLPQNHQKLLQGYLPLRLHYCEKLLSTAPPQTVKQQDGGSVPKVHRQILDYLTLVAITLENEIDEFIVKQERDISFAWDRMRQHPRNDILLVQSSRILLYTISNRSKNKDILHQNLVNKFNIIGKLCQINRNQNQQKLLRPHLFQIWHQMQTWIKNIYKQNNQQWNAVCDKYQKLIPLHAKATGLNYQRPTNTKIIIDEEDARAVSDHGDNQTRQTTTHNFKQQIKHQTQHQQKSQKQGQNQSSNSKLKQLTSQNKNSKQENHQIKSTFQFETVWPSQSQVIQKRQQNQANPDITATTKPNANPFSQFDQFFTSYAENKQKQKDKSADKDQKTSNNDFGDFDQFL